MVVEGATSWSAAAASGIVLVGPDVCARCRIGAASSLVPPSAPAGIVLVGPAGVCAGCRIGAASSLVPPSGAKSWCSGPTDEPREGSASLSSASATIAATSGGGGSGSPMALAKKFGTAKGEHV